MNKQTKALFNLVCFITGLMLLFGCSNVDRIVGPDDNTPNDTTAPNIATGPPAYAISEPNVLDLNVDEKQPMPKVTVYDSDDLIIEGVGIGWRQRGFAPGCLHFEYNGSTVTHLWASTTPCTGELSPIATWKNKVYLYIGGKITVTTN